ncbi:Protein-export membrane protein SecF [uncultured delta proteobacterium]|uniref:Protein-export membrane protein SecF n=1 Tax=uncultured delta proteobacterium TaxID=34034 RepID=A0A212KDY8_9DELT|nr:Protein-export membrane protein SecF [uncultured delta proteobacterium]
MDGQKGPEIEYLKECDMGLHLIPDNLNINFTGARRFFYGASALIFIVCIAALIVSGGPKYGIDFAGGTVAHLKFSQPVAADTLKTALEGLNQPGLVVQGFEDDDGLSYLVRVSDTTTPSPELRASITSTLKEKLPGNAMSIERLESVGPKVGADLRSKAVEAMYYAVLLIAIYISGRFERRWFVAAAMAGGLAGSMYLLGLLGVPKSVLVLLATLVTVGLCWWLRLVYALGSLVSILHDVLITIGVFALMGKEFDLTIIAALLTVLGYSLNDTIIVYDRIRENLQARKDGKLSDLINRSINQTLSRTMLTSLTTLVVITSLLLFGGGIIHDFALVMFIGVLVGTYSSIFVASPILLLFGDTVIAQAEAARLEREEAAKKERNRARALT